MLNPRFKISQIFIVNFMLLLLVALAIISFVINYTLKEIEISRYKTWLKSEMAYAKTQIGKGRALADIGAEMDKIMGHPIRITLIAKNGTLLFDSQMDARNMKSHADGQKEIGTQDDCIHVATSITWNREPAVLRISASLENIMADYKILWFRLVVAFAFIVAIGIVIGLLIQKEIDSELQKLKNYLQDIARKRYDATYATGFLKEFTSIAILLRKLANKLEKSDRRKRKYTAKLKLINKQRGDIISAIGHEFKNPVAAIVGYAQTLLDDDDVPLSLRRKFLERIEQNANRITEMIDRLSFVTRLENSEITPQMSDFDIVPILERTAVSLEKKYGKRRVVLKAKSCIIHADRTMMEMVVVNLVDNALKYSDDDVEIVLEDGKLRVSDRGSGIEPPDIERVVKKYFRADKNAWDNSMGLGLAIVEYILKLHNMELVIESVVGEGTTICIEGIHTSIKRAPLKGVKR
ncbi:sensor histidine kinase [Hydrogenimonas sp.]